MKYLKCGTLIVAICFCSCKGNHGPQKSGVNVAAKTGNTSKIPSDRQQIQDLVRKALVWSETINKIDLLPAITDGRDSVYIGFDPEKLSLILKKLKASNFFSSGFIENYHQIILTLDKGIKNKVYEKWQTGDLPTFGFANDVDPWCLCQDVPYDKPSPWNLVEVQIINLNDKKGELIWKWGKLELNGAPDWKDFSYKFDVEKENGRWKISYLQGFDFQESTRKDGI